MARFIYVLFPEYIMLKEVLLGTAFENHYLGPLIMLTFFFILAFIVHMVIYKILRFLTKKTESELDDKIRRMVRNPITLTVVIAGVYITYISSGLFVENSLLAVKTAKTLLIILWMDTLARIVSESILHYRNGEEELTTKRLSKQMLPFMERISKAIIFTIALFLLLVVWEVNISPLLASAGILSLAVAFAAKDTIANVFGGLSIFFDKTYEIGHYIIVDDNYRGVVTDIGLRTTKIRTRDDIVVIVPNSLMASTTVVNETGEHKGMLRVRMKLGVAYGEDIRKVEKLLMSIAKKAKWVAKKPEPRLRFRIMGESALEFEFLFWVKEPEWRGRALSEMNGLVYEQFNKKKIKIGYVSEHEVKVKKK